jgi:hypothetical protein
MTKYKKQELSEEEVAKAKLELEEANKSDDEEMSDEESDEKDEKKEKKDKKSFDEKCKDKVKEHLIQKENISEIKTMIPEGVSEEFVENFDTVVVGLINEQVQKISDALIADFMEEMDTALEEAVDVHKEYIDKFISVELDSFKESQKEAIISSIKVEKAEKFLNSLKDIFTENHFILDEEKLTQVGTAETKVAQLEAELNKHYEKIAILKETINEKEIALQLNELTSSMTELDKTRLLTMLESVNKKDSANYIKEAQKLKSFLLNETIKTSKETEVLDVVTESTKSDESELSLNELLNKYNNKGFK